MFSRGILVFILIATPCSATTKPRKAVAVLSGVQGKVFVNSKPAQTGTPVYQKSSIDVRAKSKATVIFKGSQIVHLAEKTVFKVEDYKYDRRSDESTGNLSLKFGKVRALIKAKGPRKNALKFKTRSATMGVRGTHFVMTEKRTGSNQEEIPKTQFIMIEGSGEIYRTPTSRLPDTPTPEPVTLKENQSFETSSEPNLETSSNASPASAPKITKMDRSEVQGIADAVAPPPPEINTAGELGQMEAFGHVGPHDLSEFDEPVPIFFLDLADFFDPLADGGGSVTIHSRITAQ